MTRILAALALAFMAAPASPAVAAARHRFRPVCVTFFDPGAGTARVCGVPFRRR